MRREAADLAPVLALIIAGDALDVSAEIASLEPQVLLTGAAEHDVVPLVAERLLRLPGVPPRLADRLLEQAHAAAVADLVRESEIRRFVEALDRAQRGALLVKGSHLAYTHYSRPDLRARVDTDVLIPRSALTAVHEVLTQQLGYEPSNRVFHDLTAPQRAYFRRTAFGAHAFDIHWQLSSPRVFATMPSYESMMADAQPVPQLGSAARVPSAVHALLIACVHRVAHHLDAPDLKWLFDIHLIARRFSAQEWERFVALATRHQVRNVCQRSLVVAAQWFATPLPERIQSGEALRTPDDQEPSAVYLEGRAMVHRVLADARLLSPHDRIRLVCQHLFPPESYIRTTYAPGSRLPMAALYSRRIVRGMSGWFRRPSGSNTSL